MKIFILIIVLAVSLFISCKYPNTLDVIFIPTMLLFVVTIFLIIFKK